MNVCQMLNPKYSAVALLPKICKETHLEGGLLQILQCIVGFERKNVQNLQYISKCN